MSCSLPVASFTRSLALACSASTSVNRPCSAMRCCSREASARSWESAGGLSSAVMWLQSPELWNSQCYPLAER
ncbi:hypothetical protein E2C01_000200 [Portunus trituberculatus]|uniref:Uncharacterized protein n=1 Tax=Portunus trituberculatus TaxID=210409 RepID=A0A5B7CE17_PORTR|nr:hypothetical protein [Portunus trituberculatus]